MSIEVGSVVEGVVSGITNFGAFIELPEGKTGLIHISEVADEYVKDVHDFLTEKDKVKVKVVAIDEKGKIGLSIKQLQEKKADDGASSASFEDKLSKFLKDSDERLTDLRRKTDSKRGGRGSRRFD